jgi:acetyl-CoA carboxylase biotin carboxylase subunit
MFKKILIANRGEIVLVISSEHVAKWESKLLQFTLRQMQKVCTLGFADEAVCIGPPPSTILYLKMSNIIAAAETSKCRCHSSRLRFLSENAKFLKFVKNTESNSSELPWNDWTEWAIKQQWLKLAPCVPGSGEFCSLLHEDAVKVAKEIG